MERSERVKLFDRRYLIPLFVLWIATSFIVLIAAGISLEIPSLAKYIARKEFVILAAWAFLLVCAGAFVLYKKIKIFRG